MTKSKISSVHFKYTGTEEQFENFVKNVVKDYIVESVCCSRSESSDIIGSYPIEQDGRSDDEILDFNLKKVNLDDSDDNDVPAATP